MRTGFILLFLFYLVQSGKAGIVKRQNTINDVCITTKDDEYTVAKSFYKQFNENNKFIDTSFNSTNYLNTSVWSNARSAELWKIDQTTGLMVPVRFYSTSISSFYIRVKNNLTSTFQAYWVRGAGTLSTWGIVKPGGSWNLGAYVGNCWYYQNLNTSQVLAFRIGEPPFLISNVTIYTSQLTKTNYDYIEKPYMFYSNDTSSSGSIFIPNGVVSSTDGTAFTFTLNNDLNDSYTAYLIDVSGNPISYNSMDPGSTFTQDSYFGYVWFLKNNNPSKQETLYIKLGEVPFTSSGVTINLSNVLSTVEDIVPISTLKPYRSHQGSIGDCYILACLIAIHARYPEKIISKFIYPSKFRSTGAVLLKTWNSTSNCWKPYVLDDYFPKSGASFYGESASDYNEYWASFLEKVFAKTANGYPNISNEVTKLSVKYVYQTLLGPINYTQAYYAYNSPNMSPKIISLFKSGAVISLASRTCNASGSFTGLSCYHGYGLVDLQENVAGTNFTLLKFQNPNGKGGESNLSWSDTSTIWDQYPDVKAALNPQFQNEGAFWIEKADISKAFELIYAAKVI